MKVVLDLNCHACGADRFDMPESHVEGRSVNCARCGTFRCDTGALEKALLALRTAGRGAPSPVQKPRSAAP